MKEMGWDIEQYERQPIFINSNIRSLIRARNQVESKQLQKQTKEQYKLDTNSKHVKKWQTMRQNTK